MIYCKALKGIVLLYSNSFRIKGKTTQKIKRCFYSSVKSTILYRFTLTGSPYDTVTLSEFITAVFD